MATPDCVVVGGGLAGMVAANRLLELGRRPVVLERGTEPGGLGNARLSGGFLHIGWLPMDAPIEELRRRVTEVTDGVADPELVDAYVRNAGRAVTWLGTQGVELLDRAPVDRSEVGERRSLDQEVHTLAPREPAQQGERAIAERGPFRALQRLYAVAQERGADIRLGAAARELVRSKSGWEVRYESRGERWSVAGSTVLVTDGGFATNRELLTRYVGANAGDALRRSSPASSGAGLRMLIRLGAAVTGLGRVYGHLVSASALGNDRLWPHPTVDELGLAGLLVGRAGDRYPTAAPTGVALVNELVRTHDPRGFSIVMDSDLWESVGRDNPTGNPPNPTIPDAGGVLHRGETLDQLAHAMQVDPRRLTTAVADHHAAGHGAQVRRPPFYALPVVPGITLSMGGVRVRADGAVLDEMGGPLPGLYAAGSAAGGLQGGPRGGYVGGLSAALVFGLLAAEAVGAPVPG